jgi:cell division protease FtsH
LVEAAMRAEFLAAALVIVGGALVALYVTKLRGRRAGRSSASRRAAQHAPDVMVRKVDDDGSPPDNPSAAPTPIRRGARAGRQPGSRPAEASGSPDRAAQSDGDGSTPDGSASAPEPPNVSFVDIAGLDDAVAELREISDYLAEPHRYEALGAELPHGILLYGDPGCGKTLLARALAGEAGVPFFSTSAATFVERYVGTGASRVRELFEQAAEQAPSIVFIDELDAVGRERSGGAGGDREYDQTLNQLLTELDGFDRSADVLLVGATNRPELIDSALLRPGRFDRRVHVEKPDAVGRERILRLHATNRPFSRRVDWQEVAESTAGLSAAELASIVNEAALLAARRSRDRIIPEDLDDACDRVVAGTSTSRLLTRAERRVSAAHEAGHALLSILVTGMQPPSRVSIIGPTASFDRSIWEAGGDRTIRTRHELLAQLIVLLGGRAAELHIFDEPSTRAEDDLEYAGSLARRMVERWAMTGRYELAGDRSNRDLPYSEGSAGASEVRGLLNKAERAAERIIAQHDTAFGRVAESLAVHETVSASELRALVDESPGSSTAIRRVAGSEGA